MKLTAHIRQTFSAALGLLLLAALAYGLFVAIRASVQVLSSLNSDIAVAIIAAAAAALVSVLSIILGKMYEARAIVQNQHREKKIPVYEDLLKFMFRVLMGEKTGDRPSEKEMTILCPSLPNGLWYGELMKY